MASGSILPQELLCRPTALIALTGLDITYNAIHKLIWDSFCNNRRPDRVPLQFKVVPGDHEYPKCGTNKRQTYEWYIPKGILKTSWMNKHLYKIPAVVVVFFDLDWDEALWKEKQMECATRVEIVRNSLQGRAAKVVVVLIQKNAPLPPGEDVVAAERATSLCSACELSAKHLYVLPHTDHLIGYTIRLENAFYELAQSYYHGEARKVKSHRDFLNKTTHQLLFVRHQFKIAFYQELKQDSHTALKHYKQAYGHLLELRMHDTNILEIKTIAGFINYKICRLSFQHNAPLDSIAQFRKHIDFFKGKVGLSELAFEHSAWMSKQFQVFGDLFDEAIKLGLAAIQTQHPGFYYQQAANHAINRKHLCRGLCKPLTTLLHSNPLEQLDSLDYFGQRPWRQGHQSIDPPDLQKEKEGIAALQNQELQVDHSWQIIPLLSSAVSQFKKYKSPRMKRFLMVQMGEEYYHARDHVKALTLLSKVTWDYRVERWWSLLASVLDIALKCSYLTANIGCYVSNCLELIGKYTGKPPEERTRIQMNLIRVISNDAPEPEPGLDAVCIESARGLWSSQTEAYSFNVDMQNIASFIECKATFTRDSFPADTEVHVQVYIQVNCQFPVRFSKLSVTLNNQIYNQYCQVVDGHEISAASEHDGNEGNLYLVPMETRVFEFSFLPVKDESHEIHDILLEINSIILELGSENGRCAHLKWIGSGGSMVTSPAQGNLYPRRSKKDKPVDINELDIIQITKVVPRKANIDVHIEHQLPCLLNEFFLIEVEATNREESAIKDLRLACGFNENDDSASGIDITSHICLEKPFFDGKVENHAVEIISSSLNPGEKVKKKIFLKHMSLGNKSINLKLMYAVTIHKNNKEIPCLCEHIETVAMTIVSPFEVSVRLNSLKFEQIEVIQQEEPVLLMTDIKCTSPWSVELQSSKLQMDVGVKLTDEETLSQLEGVCLKTGECASETVCLQTHNFNQPMVSLGTYTIHWRRNTPEYPDAPYISTSFPLPEMKTDHVPISMELKLPAFGRVKELLPLCYVIYNRTQYPQEMEVTMEANDSFMFSGNKQFHFRILPSKAYNLTYNLFPLIAGHIALPKIHITMVRYQDNIDSLAQKMLPSHVFIKPTGKHISVYEEKFCKEI